MRGSFVKKTLVGLGVLCVASGGATGPTTGAGDSRERTVVTGSVSSYMWVLNDGDAKNERGKESCDCVLGLYGMRAGYRDYGYSKLGSDVHKTLGRGLDTWGAGYDAALSVGLRSGKDEYGTMYGADFALSVPVGAAGVAVLNSLSGKGSRVFARTVLGDFSLGYQEGVESLMRINVLGSVVGEVGSAWGKYTRYMQRYTNGVPFHMFPGLYSENLLRTEAGLSSVRGRSVRFVDVLNAVPSRFNYVSPKLGGVSVGFSYALAANARDEIRGPAFEVSDAISKIVSQDAFGTSHRVRVTSAKVLGLRAPRFDARPEYRNILSAALRYELGTSRAGMAAVLSAEYAKRRKLADLLPSDYDYSDAGWLVEYNDLAAVSAGAEANYKGIRGAFAVGLLGRSGKPQSYVRMDREGIVIEKTRIKVPYAKQRGHSFYLVSSLAYTDGPVTASVGYYMSRLNYNPLRYVPQTTKVGDFVSPFDGVNELHDVVIGVGYNVYRRGSANLEMFLNCHLYMTKQHYRKYTLQRDLNEFSLADKGTTKSRGVVALTGLKFTF